MEWQFGRDHMKMSLAIRHSVFDVNPLKSLALGHPDDVKARHGTLEGLILLANQPHDSPVHSLVRQMHI